MFHEGLWVVYWKSPALVKMFTSDKFCAPLSLFNSVKR